MSTYCSLAEAKDELKAQGTLDDDKLLRYVRQVSSRIDKIMAPQRGGRPVFQPWKEERTFEVLSRYIRSDYRNSFDLKSHLLEIIAADVSGQDVTSALEIYPRGASPATQVRFTDGAHSWYDFCTSSRDPIYLELTGFWGLHQDYANAWLAVDEVTNAAVAPGATSFTVANSDGADPFGIAPRFSAGQLLRLGTEPEILYLASQDDTTNTLTVTRAQNGTSAPAGNAAIGTVVYVFQVEEPIRRITARQAAAMLARKGAFEVQTLDGAGITTFPQDLLAELKDTLTDYLYV